MTSLKLATNQNDEDLLVSLPFRVFIWIADADHHIDSDEVEVFMKMLKRPRWCHSHYLKDMLPSTKARYTEFWKAFQKGKIKNELAGIQQGVQFLSNHLSPTEAKVLFGDLFILGRSIARASGGIMGMGSISKEEHLSLHQLSIVLECQRMSTQTPEDGKVKVETTSENSEEHDIHIDPLISMPFRILVWVAGADFDIDSQEVNCFKSLLNETQWCQSSYARIEFPKTLEAYPDFWRAYQREQITKELGAIQGAIEQLSQKLSIGELQLLINDLNRLADSIAKVSGGFIGIASISREENLALKQLSIALEYPLLLHQSANETEKPKEGALQHTPPPISAAIKASETYQYMPVGAVEPEQLERWKKGKLQVHCVEVIATTHDVKTFRFVTDPPSLFSHKPGQFLTFNLEIEGKPVVRSYTISSTPSRPHTIEVTVKRVPGGLVSNWLHDNMKVGDEVTIKGPGGKFNFFEHPSSRALMISGGSGITPVMSMSRWICDTGAKTDVVFLHAARSPQDIINQKELEMMDHIHENFRLLVTVSDHQPEDHWKGLTGRISLEMIKSSVPDFMERTVYVCGPAPMMEATKKLLEDGGFPMNNYFQESFGGAPKPAAKAKAKTPSTSAPFPAPSGTEEMICFTQSEQELAADPEITILELAEENGLQLACACRSGVCGSCKVLKTEGEVSMDCTDGLEDEEIEEGYILTCVSHPKGRVVIDA